MPLVSTKELLTDARRNGYAVPAFPAHHLDMIRAVTETAEAMQSPVILQATPATLKQVGADFITAMVRTAADRVPVPVSLHLDHGDSFTTVIRCLRQGFTSVMIDGSHLPFQENIRLVKKVTEAAHAAGVPVESELGTIDASEMTDPADAEEFVTATGTDFLAPAFGTAHGVYRKAVRLDLARLEAIACRTGIPLVMHGASGVPPEEIRRSIRAGIAKVNFSTELKQIFSATLRRFLTDSPEETDPRKIFRVAREGVSDVIREKIAWTQSAGEPHRESPA
ncbi:MAG: class II fructose-bisphosphate aldolase [Firmicutes bacterium]|uniref:Fructose-bisphosphate aldolase, class II n=1 Tax=Melghirimyces thermohalophilus TaxID=1236220 RepID=A0A1G6HJQ1_9BACL|nr:class II fructose-bisphosphate aldolase [Melghirimyces thermohalophilus]MDA8351919.1 class II fructose-bisphosphate aldolase [Bacillota bacterium]SDB94480.1 fructose-bisphosphate aldolase, class II [Melghirimyces thermohalophilus]